MTLEPSINQRYPLNVWLFTICVSPAIFIFCFTFRNLDFNRVFEITVLIIIAIFVGAFISVPALLIYWLIFNKVKYAALSAFWKKSIFAMTGIMLMLTTFFLLDSNYYTNRGYSSLMLPLIYAITLTSGSFVCRLNSTTDPLVDDDFLSDLKKE